MAPDVHLRRHMAGPSSVPDSGSLTWSVSLGVIAIVFGTLMAATQGNELLAQLTIAPDSIAARNVPADCRPDEAAQEGVSTAECELMVANVRIMIASRPSWFRGVYSGLNLAGSLAAFGSIIVGLALTGGRSWGTKAAMVAFAVLMALDLAQFTAAFYTGPLLRALYLWNIVLWLFIHLSLEAGAIAGRRATRLTTTVPTAAAA
jgi:hypothetical protein